MRIVSSIVCTDISNEYNEGANYLHANSCTTRSGFREVNNKERPRSWMGFPCTVKNIAVSRGASS